ncbi:hypothetical protein ACI6PS_00905 [Flavobacterium sp. PLA-1-15]|uniref:hypothetical protein n=1 Tax=Flavobacterium sp. PLA-1-15 TaxID=3380533 RepID=UPI003B7670F0
MKTIFSMVLFFFICNMSAQTSAELIGKWQLVKWTHNGKEKSLVDTFKTDQVFQLFKPDGKFESIVGDEVHHSKWKLSKDNKELTIVSALLPIKFTIDYFDAKKRIITHDTMGTLEYKKVE